MDISKFPWLCSTAVTWARKFARHACCWQRSQERPQIKPNEFPLYRVEKGWLFLAFGSLVITLLWDDWTTLFLWRNIEMRDYRGDYLDQANWSIGHLIIALFYNILCQIWAAGSVWFCQKSRKKDRRIKTEKTNQISVSHTTQVKYRLKYLLTYSVE